MVEVDGEVEVTVRSRQRWRGVEGGCTKGGGDGAATMLREATVRHRGRQRQRGIGIEGGDDGTEGGGGLEGGGGKLGSLTAQNQNFTVS
jgi:hypothetical protein